MKFNHYRDHWANSYYWRTKAQAEIDYLEEAQGQLNAFEFKWNPNAKAILSKTFSNAYPKSSFQVIHRDNFEEFIL